MKCILKKTVCLIFCALLISSLIPIRTDANSAQAHWQGVNSTGAMVVGEDCPIVVTNELLTLDITEFPSNYYHDAETFLKYSGKVTAEYTFYNPSDLAVTATLVFPFGKQPDYADVYDAESGTYFTNTDTKKYGITVNGEEIEKSVRYTFKPNSVHFNPSYDPSVGLWSR